MSSDVAAAAVAPGELELLDIAAANGRDPPVAGAGCGFLHADPHRDGHPEKQSPLTRGGLKGNEGSESSPRSSSPSVTSPLSRTSSGRSAKRLAGLRRGSSPAGTPTKKMMEISLIGGKTCEVGKKVVSRVLRQGTVQRMESCEIFNDEVKDEALNIRNLWRDVMNEEHSDGKAFSEEVASLLHQQELDCLLPEDRLDEPTAQLDIFARWLFQRLGKDYNRALLLLTRHKWLDDKQTSLLLERLIVHNTADNGPQDEAFVAPDLLTGNTPLHQLAKLDYTDSSHVLFASYPELWRVENLNGALPLEVAIDNSCDKIAVKLMDDMPNDHVRDIFKKRRNFSDLLNNAKMRDASHAVLDRLIAEWPEGDEEGAEQGYDFYYQPLESDKQGRLPGDEGFNGFNSCFMDILRKKKLYQEFGNKRVVRLLLYTKWKSYGEKMLWFSGIAFFASILVLTYATEMATAARDPRQYNNAADYVRAVTEVIMLLILASLALGEIMEMIESRHNCRGYWTDHYNLAQISTFCLLFAVVPLRYLDPDGRAQWVLLSLGYFITMTRSFKFISTSSLVGVYTRVIIGILVRVMPKFFIVFGFVLVAWAGAWYPALRAHDRGISSETNMTMTDIGLILETSSYWENLFLGLRIMIEGRNLISYYNNAQQLGGLAVFYYLGFLSFVALIMRTILIAQMAATYNSLNRDAVHQLELNRSWVLPSLEQISLLNGKWSLIGDWRRKYYLEKESISAKVLQVILQEEKVDGFVRLERLLHKQKAEQETKQLQLLQHIDHQTVLEEKWHNIMMSSVQDTRHDLHDQVTGNRDTTVECGDKTVAVVAETRQVLGDQISGSSGEQLVSAVQDLLRQESKEQERQLAGIQTELQEQKQRHDRMESSISQVVLQTDQLSQYASQSNTSDIKEELVAVQTLVEEQSALLKQLADSMQSLTAQNNELRQEISTLSSHRGTQPAAAAVAKEEKERGGFFQRLGDRVDDALGDSD